jgi:hypothetical protein
MAGRESKLVAAKTEVIQHCALPQLSCKAHWPARSAPSPCRKRRPSPRELWVSRSLAVREEKACVQPAGHSSRGWTLHDEQRCP